MKAEAVEYVWLEWCSQCKRKHFVKNQPCPECEGRGGWTPQPVSDRVANTCYHNNACEGCRAYLDHTGAMG